MALVTTTEMFKKAYEGGYAIGAFNINNMEIIQGIVSACKKHNSAVILQVSKSALKYAHPLYLKKMVDAAVEETGLDIALHLDHGPDFETCKLCIESGFTSVMFDGSHLELDENIKVTKEVIKLAKKYGADVEAEIGCVGGSEDGSEDIAINCTKPEDAVKFEKETGVDALAIAIGNAHGNYKSTPKLRFDILEEVEKNTKLPLVLHGGTGITPDDFVRCAHTGIKKINIATATFDSVEHTVKSAYEKGEISGYYDLQGAEVEGAYQNAKKHILIFGTDNKA